MVSSPGVLTISGNYTETSASSLEIGLGGTTPGVGFDQRELFAVAEVGGQASGRQWNGDFHLHRLRQRLREYPCCLLF